MRFVPNYDRRAVVRYAHRWAYGRNPAFYDYEEVGGDCTNFASQCVFAGSGVMNFTADLGWYYIDANQKAPAWTGVEFFWNFMTRREISQGPVGVECDLADLRPGDLVQLSFSGETFQHTPVVVALRRTAVDHNIRLMHRLGREQLFGNILEAARGEKEPARLRAYVSIFEEYFTYWSAGQKEQTLDFLYELLMVPDGDIRRQAAALIGRWDGPGLPYFKRQRGAF